MVKTNSHEDEEEEEIFEILTTDLPSEELKNLWDSLVFENKLKEGLLNYINTLGFLHEKDVDKTLCGANNIMLLHGPPGTGKTSLCKALAQQATLDLIEKKRYERGILVEINASSIFSKWFGETGKQVQMMFEEVEEEVSDPKQMVFVLVDEIESLTMARKNSATGHECSDSVLAVNTLLTEMDKMKKYKNVLILTTSNITDLIDLAFISRADIKKYIGLPTLTAIDSIYRSVLVELQKKDVIRNLDLEQNNNGSSEYSDSDLTWFLANKSLEAGFSGRTLRKIPFIALSYSSLESGMDKMDFFFFMERAIDEETEQVSILSYSGNTA